MLQFMLCCIALLVWVVGALVWFLPPSVGSVCWPYIFCWLVASGFWLLGRILWALWEFSLLGSLFWIRAAWLW
jgi:hypothetical protein